LNIITLNSWDAGIWRKPKKDDYFTWFWYPRARQEDFSRAAPPNWPRLARPALPARKKHGEQKKNTPHHRRHAMRASNGGGRETSTQTLGLACCARRQHKSGWARGASLPRRGTFRRDVLVYDGKLPIPTENVNHGHFRATSKFRPAIDGGCRAGPGRKITAPHIL